MTVDAQSSRGQDVMEEIQHDFEEGLQKCFAVYFILSNLSAKYHHLDFVLQLIAALFHLSSMLHEDNVALYVMVSWFAILFGRFYWWCE